MGPKKRTHTVVQNGAGPKNPKNAKRQRVDALYTIYVSNLNTHIKARKMKANLYILFSSFADVVEINYPRKNLRGQGWIVVSSPRDAVECVEKINGSTVFNNVINLQFARKDSNIINELNRLDEQTQDRTELEEQDVE